MFAITARFSDLELPLPTNGKMWEAGREYQEKARLILSMSPCIVPSDVALTNVSAKIFHRSRPSTVQALLLLGYREFGIGSMEQGWIYIGMCSLSGTTNKDIDGIHRRHGHSHGK